MNSPKVAQDIKMQRAGFDAFRSSLAQAFEVPFAGRQFAVAQLSLLFDQAPGRLTSPAIKAPRETRKLSQTRL